MTDITTSLMVQLQRSVDSIRDTIAKDGLRLLKSVLSEAGFDDSEFLDDYELQAIVNDDEIVYEILLSVDSLEETDLSKQVMDSRKTAMDSIDEKFEEATVRRYGLSKDNKIHRISSMHDARNKSHDTKKRSQDTKKKSRDTQIRSSTREFNHKIAAAAPRSLGAPRSMEVGKSGKLNISFTRKLKTTNSGIKYPEKDFEGLMKKFLDGLQDIIYENFVPELKKILSRNM